MSELKDYDIMDIEAMDDESLKKSESGRIQVTRVYIKSEADKVIADLKKERDWLAKDRAQAYDDLEKRAQLNIKQEEAIRHQKYKRCLAMAKMCREQAERYRAEFDIDEWFGLKWIRWSKKWHKRWLELAEKFKEAK